MFKTISSCINRLVAHLKSAYLRIFAFTSQTKIKEELNYWKNRFDAERGKLQNKHYQSLMLSISGKDKSFFEEKTVCDFGCGPRGSLEWLAADSDLKAKCYCVDTLVDDYYKLGANKHLAEYIKSSEKHIPLPDNSCDIVFTINSLDHVDNIELISNELIRITKPGMYLCGSINLNEPSSVSEPQTITLDLFEELIGKHIIKDRFLIAPKWKGEGNTYTHLVRHCETGESLPPLGDKEVGYLWFSGRVIKKRSKIRIKSGVNHC